MEQDSKYPMDHWRCQIRRNGDKRRSLTTLFSMGSGHNGAEPELRRVLDCLASDAQGAEEVFVDWCRDLGYDTDSVRAVRTYKACKATYKKLQHFLGEREFGILLYHTERE
jgi:hypothetical protein